MNVQNYVIEHLGLDWPALLEEWRWLLPQAFTVRLLTRAGDLLIESPDGCIHFLDVGAGELRHVAISHNEFRSLLGRPDVARDWLMVPVIDRLVAAGRLLGPGQCYGFRLLPVVGGGYDANDRLVLPIREHFGVCGSLHRQIADLPDGAKVQIRIVD
jgi:hypothetical protein